jgi:hypothetical protein
LAPWAIVPWVISAQPADAPAFEVQRRHCDEFRRQGRGGEGERRGGKAEVAAKRESIRLKRGANERLLRTAPIKKSVASPRPAAE